MAKMFYTLEEVCEKLGKDEDEVREMVRSGQIQEFRDRDKLMFKVEQIDLLAGGEEEDTSDVQLDLEDTGAPSSSGSGISLRDESGSSGSAIGLADSGETPSVTDTSDAREDEAREDEAREQEPQREEEDARESSDSREGTGISVFDTDHGGEQEADKTQAGEAVEEEVGLDAVGSGSGLLDLTRESDDTSLGAELLEEVYSSEENPELPAHASGLFEAAGSERGGGEEATPQPGAGVPVLVEAYDGGGSGLGVGLMIGALAALICVAIVGIVGVSGATPVLATKIAANEGSIWMWAGGLLGVTAVLGLIGLFIGKASE